MVWYGSTNSPFSIRKKELISIFIYTFKQQYFEYLIGNSIAYFMDIVTTTKMIDRTLKLGNIRNLVVKFDFHLHRAK
jgi:hypothetical protein